MVFVGMLAFAGNVLAQQPGVVTQTMTVRGAGMDPVQQAQVVEALEQARLEIRKLMHMNGKHCGAIKERAALIGEKADLKIEHALMVLQKAGGGNAAVQVHVKVPQEPAFIDEAVVMAPVAETPPVMTPAEVGNLSSAMKAESFADDKLRVLQLGMSGAYLHVADVMTLLGQFQFSEDKLKALGLMARYIYDRENNFQILQSFTFSDDKEQAQRLLRP